MAATAATRRKPLQMEIKTVSGVLEDDWLAVSTEGFREQNLGREPGHLVKELIQNAMDAIDGTDGVISLQINYQSIEATGKKLVHIVCSDNGCGIEDLELIRTVFWTSKKDSPLERGRMGRGFKELLSVSDWCMVSSKGRALRFFRKGAKRVRQMSGRFDKDGIGTSVEAFVEWPEQIIDELVSYFSRFIMPANIAFTVNDAEVGHRETSHTVSAKLPTEIFEGGKWLKPGMDTTIELVRTTATTDAPFIYEMGIPVCPAEWDRPYHINVMQRVPQNPNRDAVASGYPTKLHRACLPTLINEMRSEDLRQEWVGEVAPNLSPEVQKTIINKGWGNNIVRSVPTMGDRRDHDADARDLGHDIVKTQHLSAGFREIITQNVPTSAQAVVTHERQRVQQASLVAFTVMSAFDQADVEADRKRAMIEAVGGRDRVEAVMSFSQWFCTRLLESYNDGGMCGGVNIGPLLDGNNRVGKPAVATWSVANILTLGLDTPELWVHPLGAYTLQILIHEAAHYRAFHHGDAFHEQVEYLAGVSASLMLNRGAEVRQKWPLLF